MGVLLNFVNKVADGVGKKYPDVKIGTLAYQYSHKPPKNIRPRDNVQINLCADQPLCRSTSAALMPVNFTPSPIRVAPKM
jgi:hypothetical protein